MSTVVVILHCTAQYSTTQCRLLVLEAATVSPPPPLLYYTVPPLGSAAAGYYTPHNNKHRIHTLVTFDNQHHDHVR